MTNFFQESDDTILLHAGQEPDPTTGSRALPIYQTTSYVFKSTEHAKNLFALAEPGNIYTRIMNPTTDAFEQRVAALEDGVAAVAVSSGMAAITYAILNIAGTGDEIVADSNIYGGTYSLFVNTLPRYGITVRLVDATNPDAVRAAINDKTKAVFGETITNPSLNVFDIETISEIAHENDIPLIIDNTFAPYFSKPFHWGADIIVHSATKWIGGHGTSIGGVVVDSGRFDWSRGKFPGFTEPDESYGGVKYADLGAPAFALKVRVQLLRDTGASISPHNSFLLMQGLETLHLRLKKHNDNAAGVVKYLENHPGVNWVNYPGQKDHPTHNLAKKYFKEQSDSTDIPFIFLSAGVTIDLFKKTLILAAKAGSTFNGVLCGRATWKDSVDIFADKGEEAAKEWLATVGKKNIVDLDEILKGTNSTDKAIGSRKFVEKLVASNATGIIATHDLSLCEIENELEEVKNYYFDAEIINDELYFDYTFKTGVCKNMNASFLLKKMKII